MLDIHKAESAADYDAIEKNILKLLDDFPAEGELLKLYGDVLTAKNEKDKALEFYEKAVDVLKNGVVLLELAKKGIAKAVSKVYDEDGAYSYEIEE